MGLFGFKKEKKIEVPIPPKATGFSSDRHTDDLEKPTPSLNTPLFPDMPKLDLPELEAPEEEKVELPELKLPEMPKFGAREQKSKETGLFKFLPELEEAAKPEMHRIAMPREIEVPETLPELEDIEYMPRKQKPVFMDIRKYNEMIEQLNQMRTKITDYAAVSTKMIELKDEKERAMEKYRYALEDIERKLLYIDRAFFEGG